ncbi:hypothetical protein LZ906_016025 (plasmid) [Paraclostridium ghonii]|uniref:hypothetical protein n=1 Tax=Paraclostridium ghonii TaxID=29358 RepID=UPI00352661BA
MIEVFKLNIEIVRQRFKIYGFFNIVTLFAVISAILFGLKFAQFKIGHYNELTVLLTAIILAMSFEGVIPKKLEKKIFNVKTYFNKLDFKSIENFYMYKNLGLLYILLTFVIIPLDLNYFGNFIFFLMSSSLIICLQLAIKSKLTNEKYTTVSSIIKALLLVTSYAYTHEAFVIPFDEILNIYTIILYLIISGFLIKSSFRLLYNESNTKNNLYFLNLSQKIFKVIPNRDLICVIRKNILIKSIFTIIIVNLFVKKSNSTYFYSFITCVLAYTCAYVNIYVEVLKQEGNRLLFFYSCKEFKLIRKEKIISIFYISLPIFIITIVPLLFTISFKTILLSYIISIIVFSVSATIIKISLEKDNDVVKIINHKQIISLFIISIILSIAIANLMKNLII